MNDRTRRDIDEFHAAMDELHDPEPVVIDARTGRVITSA